MIREFVTGVRLLLRGFSVWRTRPGLMALGLVPAVIALVLLIAAILPLVLGMGSITAWATPFADGWVEPWRSLFRTAVGFVIVAAAVFLASAVFTALTLTIGDPFYQRIWHAVDIGPAPRVPAVAPEVLHALRQGDAGMLAASLRNDLQAPALHLRPDLARVLERGESSGALAGLVSGSGPTLAFLAADEESAIDLQVTLSAAGLVALHVHGPVGGARVL